MNTITHANVVIPTYYDSNHEHYESTAYILSADESFKRKEWLQVLLLSEWVYMKR